MRKTTAQGGWKRKFGLLLWILAFARKGEPQQIHSKGYTSPGPPVAFYQFQARREYLNDSKHTVRCSLLFLDGERTLWAEKADYPVGNTYIVRETGRSFVEWEIPGKGEIRVYSKKGKRLFDHAGRLWAVSGSGRFMVCRFPGEGTGPECPWDAIVGVDDKDIQKVDIGEGFEVEAVAEDGKSYLVSEKEGDEAFHEYYLRDIRGRVLWEKSGSCHFLGLEGPWALWAKNNGKTVAYSDFRTGESKMEIPVWKYLQLHQHFYGICFKL